MTKEDGGLQWSRDHNSRFEGSKSVILHATRRTQLDPEDEGKRIPLDKPPLIIDWRTTNPGSKQLQVPRHLNWRPPQLERVSTEIDCECNQLDHAILKAHKATNRGRRQTNEVTLPSGGSPQNHVRNQHMVHTSTRNTRPNEECRLGRRAQIPSEDTTSSNTSNHRCPTHHSDWPSRCPCWAAPHGTRVVKSLSQGSSKATITPAHSPTSQNRQRCKMQTTQQAPRIGWPCHSHPKYLLVFVWETE